ncbi:hypothetical protein ACIQMO_03160 [Streptomyces sp. NPDC091406]|uniref:hypothetical protein n=1 Tax=unclassified Streptomyces TaxID=2593676 RepID=UPI003802198F
MAREYSNGKARGMGGALLFGGLAMAISLVLALIYPSVSIWLLVAMMVLLNSFLLVVRAAPDGRTSKIFRVKSKQDKRYLLVMIPVGTALAGAFFMQEVRGPAMIMWGAMFIAAVRVYISSAGSGARGEFSSNNQ